MYVVLLLGLSTGKEFHLCQKYIFYLQKKDCTKKETYLPTATNETNTSD